MDEGEAEGTAQARAPAPRPMQAQRPSPAPRYQPGARIAEPRRATQRADLMPSMWIDPGAAEPIPVREATAVLAPTRGNHVSGVVRFRDNGETLDVIASVDGLTGGPHAYHVHVYGDCASANGNSAGPHFHFSGSSFDREVPIITGDLGELRPDDKLTTVHRARVRASLHGPYSIIGRAVVVHAEGNDPSQPPDGGAGKRLACGVIGISGPAGAPATARR